MRLTTAQKRYRLLRPPPVQWNDDHGRWESVRPLDAEVLVELDRFHATPVASVLANRPPRWEPWEAVSARYREAYVAEQARTPGRDANRLRLIAEAARRARPC